MDYSMQPWLASDGRRNQPSPNVARKTAQNRVPALINRENAVPMSFPQVPARSLGRPCTNFRVRAVPSTGKGRKPVRRPGLKVLANAWLSENRRNRGPSQRLCVLMLRVIGHRAALFPRCTTDHVTGKPARKHGRRTPDVRRGSTTAR